MDFEPGANGPEKLAVETSVTADSGAVAENGLFTAFVASLTPEQKAKLAALLTGG